MQLDYVCISAHNNTEILLVFKEELHEVRGVDVSELLLFLKTTFRERCFRLIGDFRTGLRVSEVDDLSLCAQEISFGFQSGNR